MLNASTLTITAVQVYFLLKWEMKPQSREKSKLMVDPVHFSVLSANHPLENSSPIKNSPHKSVSNLIKSMTNNVKGVCVEHNANALQEK